LACGAARAACTRTVAAPGTLAAQAHDGLRAPAFVARALLLQELARGDEASAAAQARRVARSGRARLGPAGAGAVVLQAGSLAAQVLQRGAVRPQTSNASAWLATGCSVATPQARSYAGGRCRRCAAWDWRAAALTTLGALHDELGQADLGLPLHEEAWALAEQLQARHTQVDVAINLLWCCCALPQHRELGLGVGEAALALGEFDGSDTLRNNLAWAYADAGQGQRALVLYRQLAGGRDPSLACIAWSRIAGLRAAAGERGPMLDEALAQTLRSMQGTDFYVAHASAVVALVQHVHDQAAAARRYVRDDQSLDPGSSG
jgi:hypothetical protein